VAPHGAALHGMSTSGCRLDWIAQFPDGAVKIRSFSDLDALTA